MQWATQDQVDRIMAAAGLGQYRTSDQARTLATAAAFWAAEEPVVLALFRPPAVARHEVGSARLLVVTASRAIEVSGQMAGDWWSQHRSIQNGPVSVTIRDLSDFSELTFETEAVQWWLDGGDAPIDFTRGTTASLTGPAGTEALVVWSPADDNDFSRLSGKARLDFLRWLAAGRTVSTLDAGAAATGEDRL